MAKSKVPTNIPTALPLKEKIGAGKDNRVYTFDYEPRPDLAESLGPLVLKAGNLADRTDRYTAERAVNDLVFKREKYRLLSTFLGKYVPRSSFFVGSQRNPDGETVIKPYTVQQEVPQKTFADLTRDQRNSDVLRGQMFGLTVRLQNMYRVLDRAKNIVESHGQPFLVDATLDLGPITPLVKEHMNDDPRSFDYGHMIKGYKASPNLLVDPETMELSCIDFGSGEWSPELGAQLQLVYDIAQYDPGVQAQLPSSQTA